MDHVQHRHQHAGGEPRHRVARRLPVETQELICCQGPIGGTGGQEDEATRGQVGQHEAIEPEFQWIGLLGKNLTGKALIFHGKIDGFRLRFSLKPIHWELFFLRTPQDMDEIASFDENLEGFLSNGLGDKDCSI